MEYEYDMEAHIRRLRDEDPYISRFISASVQERKAMIAEWDQPATTTLVVCTQNPSNLALHLFDPEHFLDSMITHGNWHAAFVILLLKQICNNHRNGIKPQLQEEIFGEIVRRVLVHRPAATIERIMQVICDNYCFLRAFLQHLHDDDTVEAIAEYARTTEKEKEIVDVVLEYCSDVMREKHYFGPKAAFFTE
jgi:hypothetical protein